MMRKSKQHVGEVKAIGIVYVKRANRFRTSVTLKPLMSVPINVNSNFNLITCKMSNRSPRLKSRFEGSKIKRQDGNRLE